MTLRVLTAALLIGVSLGYGNFALAFNPLESKNSNVKKGNSYLKEGRVADALEEFDQAARALPGRGEVHLNRGLALSRMGPEQVDQAMQAFQLAADSSAPKEVRARAHANLGNLFFKKEDWAAAIEHYKKSLMLKPGVRDVAWNLELAMERKKLQDEQQKQNQEDQEQDNQGDQDQQDNQDQQQQKQDQGDQKQQEEEKKPEEQKQDQQKSEKDKKEQDQQSQQPQPQPTPRNKQEVEQILDSLENQEQNLAKEKLKRKGVVVPRGGHKDW